MNGKRVIADYHGREVEGMYMCENANGDGTALISLDKKIKTILGTMEKAIFVHKSKVVLANE